MKITLEKIPIKEIVKGYKNSEEEGVIGYNGKLNIRPKYQREFVYKDKQMLAVIDTVNKNFPLNVMYWVKNSEDDFEILDGQQRTLSICQYFNGDFSFKNRYFHNLTSDEQEKFLDYELMIYICEGEDSEKLDWFKTINIAGEKLTAQELRNAVYSGSWLTEAKKFFSKSNCPAHKIGSSYMKCKAIRQEYLEKALEWITEKQGIKSIERYMAEHQHDNNANELRMYFTDVINWIETLFPVKRTSLQQKVNWGTLYNKYYSKIEAFNADELEKKIKQFLQDEEIQKKEGIYEYLLSGNEKSLNLRVFDEKTKREKYEFQEGVCPICKQHFEYEQMEGDHILSWSKGGKTISNNCQMLCKTCNLQKSNK